MQYGFSIKRKCYLLSVLLMTVWLTGCVQEEFESTPSPAGNGIRFTLTVPDVNLPSVSSRTMTGAGTAKKEDEIETVDILVFDASKHRRYTWNGSPLQESRRTWLTIPL